MNEWKYISLQRKIIPILLLLLIFSSCQEAQKNTAPKISDLIIYPSSPKAGQIVLLTGIAEDHDDDPIAYKWMASAGTFLDSLGSNPIQWRAPADPDSIKIYLNVTDYIVTTTASESFYLDYGVGVVSGHITDASTGFLLNGAVININGAEVTTGNDGYFRFTDVVSGSNIPISANAMNYVTFADFIEVEVEENIVDISMTLLTEVGRVAGYVSHATTGEKLSGVIVQTGQLIDTTETDGYYELYNVPISANVPVRAVLDGYAINASLINVSAGYNTHNVALIPNVATVSGRVTTEATGALLEGVVVTINQYSGSSNAAGYYEIEDIPVTSNASVSAVLAGFISSHAIISLVGGINNLDIELQDNPGSLSGWVRSTLDGAVLVNVAVGVGPSYHTTSPTGAYLANGLATGTTLVTCSIVGYESFTVLFDIQEGANFLDIDLIPNVGTVSGFLRDAVAGISLVGKTVYLGNQSTVSQVDGSFEFSSVSVGQHQLSVSVTGYEYYSIIADVVAGNNVYNVLLNHTTGTVLGVIHDAFSGEVIEGATVSAHDLSTETDENGSYSLSSVPIGSVQISCSMDNYSDSDEYITVASGDNIYDIDMVSTIATLKGSISDSSSNTFLDSVTLTLGGDTVITGTDGLYEFDAVLVNLALALKVERRNYATRIVWVTLEQGDNSQDITLIANPGILKGYVTDSVSDSVLDSVQVIFGADTLMTGSDGYFEFEEVLSGQQHSLRAQKSGYDNYTEWVLISAGVNVRDISLILSD